MLVVFIDLLLSAKTESGWVGGIKVERGQVLTSVARLMTNTGLGSNNTVRRALKKLETSGEITRKATNAYSLITIVQFDKYQCCAENAQQSAQQSAHIKEYKNERIEERKNINSADADSVRAYACACERKPVEEYITEILMDDSWVEATCMNHRIDRFKLVKMSEDFTTECKCNGKEMADSLQNAKQWFNSWLRIRIEAERKQQKQEQQNGKEQGFSSQTERVWSIITKPVE